MKKHAFSLTPRFAVSLTPRFSGVVDVSRSKKPFQRFPDVDLDFKNTETNEGHYTAPLARLHRPLATLAIFVLFCLACGTAFGATNDPNPALQKGLFEEEANHNLTAAIQEYQAVIARFDQDRKRATTAVFRLAECYRKQGNTNDALVQYQRIIREFPDQTQLVTLSRTYLASAGTLQAVETSPPAAATSDEAEEVRRIRAMIKDSPDLINAIDSGSGNTPLHQAAAKGQLTVAEFLLANSANVDAKDQIGWTPLLWAAYGGHKALVELLLANKASIQAADPGGKTALHLAAEHGFRNVVDVLLAHGADVNAQTRFGDSPLLLAAINGFNSVAALLLGRGADPNAQAWYYFESGSGNYYKPGRGGTESHRGTPLHLAAQRGDLALAELLLTNKVNLNATNDSGQTPLSVAADKGQVAVAELLLSRGADVNARNADPGMQGWTPLHYAVSARRKEMVALLLKNKADPNARTESPTGMWPKGETPLLMACFNKSTDIIQLLLDAHADPNLADDNGSAPICLALSAGSISQVSELSRILRLLLEHGADANAKDYWYGRTPLMLAAEHRDEASLELLLSRKADVNARSKSGASALHYLIQGSPQQGLGSPPTPGLPPGFSRPVRSPSPPQPVLPPGPAQPVWSDVITDMLTALLNAGANVNVQDDTGKTPLNYVPHPAPAEAEISSSWAQIDRLLRQHGAVEDLPDFSSIRVTRAGPSQSFVVFEADTNGLNQFTVMETIQHLYSVPPGVFNNGPLRFPDFSRIRILKPVHGKPGERKEVTFNLLTSSDQFDCAKDVPLDFGDVVEIPEREHPLSEPPVGLTPKQKDQLSSCLTRHVTFRTKGQPAEIALKGTTSGTYLSAALSLPEVQKVLRSSSDLANVTVKRTVAGTGQPKSIPENVLPYWNNRAPIQNDLWLRDGDVVEVPDKP